MNSFATLSNRKLVVPSANGKYFAVDLHYFVECHREAVSSVFFDEEFYLRRYPDIAEALDAGKISTAHEHYVTQGYYEHRMPHPISVDETWYLETYPDVKAAVETANFPSAQAHFERAGFREGRLPYAGFILRRTAPVKPAKPAKVAAQPALAEQAS